MTSNDHVDVNQPAKHLAGLTVDNGWVIGDRLSAHSDYRATSFSETYFVTRGDQSAVLKALDLSVGLADKNPTEALSQLTSSFEFEKQLYELCKIKRMSRVVKILDQGVIPPFGDGVIPVPYMVLEYSDKSVQSQIDFDSRLNTVWLLTVLHNVATGLWQLHNQGVAHKNIRPETVASFTEHIQKLKELSASDQKGIENPNKKYLILVDPGYMPPEYLYGHAEKDWVYKSRATDAYQLGNLAFFLFTQSHFNTWLFFGLDQKSTDYRPESWGGTFTEVLPYLEHAYNWAITQFFRDYVNLSPKLTGDLEQVLRQLCHPNPVERGHPRGFVRGDASSMERYISIFDRLRKQAAIDLAAKA